MYLGKSWNLFPKPERFVHFEGVSRILNHHQHLGFYPTTCSLVAIFSKDVLQGCRFGESGQITIIHIIPKPELYKGILVGFPY